MATGSEGEGPPAKLRFGTKVVACDIEEGTVTLDVGEVVPADLILGADGVHVSTKFSFFSSLRLTALQSIIRARS